MPPKKIRHNPLPMILIILLEILYSGLLIAGLPITGARQWDGIIAVLFGLYGCTHPAANVIDLLLYDRGESFRYSTREAIIGWWVLNALVLLGGWMIISLGLIRFTSR